MVKVKPYRESPAKGKGAEIQIPLIWEIW